MVMTSPKEPILSDRYPSLEPNHLHTYSRQLEPDFVLPKPKRMFDTKTDKYDIDLISTQHADSLRMNHYSYRDSDIKTFKQQQQHQQQLKSRQFCTKDLPSSSSPIPFSLSLLSNSDESSSLSSNSSNSNTNYLKKRPNYSYATTASSSGISSADDLSPFHNESAPQPRFDEPILQIDYDYFSQVMNNKTDNRTTSSTITTVTSSSTVGRSPFDDKKKSHILPSFDETAKDAFDHNKELENNYEKFVSMTTKDLDESSCSDESFEQYRSDNDIGNDYSNTSTILNDREHNALQTTGTRSQYFNNHFSENDMNHDTYKSLNNIKNQSNSMSKPFFNLDNSFSFREPESPLVNQPRDYNTSFENDWIGSNQNDIPLPTFPKLSSNNKYHTNYHGSQSFNELLYPSTSFSTSNSQHSSLYRHLSHSTQQHQPPTSYHSPQHHHQQQQAPQQQQQQIPTQDKYQYENNVDRLSSQLNDFQFINKENIVWKNDNVRKQIQLNHQLQIDYLTPHEVYPDERYSRKVFVGGLPQDIDESEIRQHFIKFGALNVDWPHRAENKSQFPPKGYAFLIFKEEKSVRTLIRACSVEDNKLYINVSSPSIRDKPVQIRPWRLTDADYLIDANQVLDSRKTIFVGGVPRPLRAQELAKIIDALYGGVCYAGIDTDPELKYPKGAGRVSFSNQRSYIAAINDRFVDLKVMDMNKNVEIKPYVLDDQFCDECQGRHSERRYAQYFCSNVACLQYYCDACWRVIHSKPSRQHHKPLVKEGGNRTRLN
ncbi:hypothetical protein SNEBB_003892, partial [Seison nebaliae]